MQLRYLGTSYSDGFLLLEWEGSTILIDSPLSFSHLPHLCPSSTTNSTALRPILLENLQMHTSLPQIFKKFGAHTLLDTPIQFPLDSIQQIDNWEGIATILITNYKTITALPFITERTKFRGKIFATEPTVEIGRHIMQELVSYSRYSATELQSLASLKENFKNLPEPLQDVLNPSRLYNPNGPHLDSLYSAVEVKACLAKVQPIRYHERLVLSSSVAVTASPSGYVLGSCNYCLQFGAKKVSIFAASSKNTNRHPEILRTDSLMNSDLLIPYGFSTDAKFDWDRMCNQFLKCVATKVHGRQTVFLPTSQNSGLFYDMLDLLFKHLMRTNLIHHVNIVAISPIIDRLVSYGNVVAEWLNAPYAAKSFLPEPPLLPLSTEYIKSRFHTFQNINDSQFGNFYLQSHEPCIILVGHESLRLGDSVKVLEELNNIKRERGDLFNAVGIITDPTYPIDTMLAPFYEPDKIVSLENSTITFEYLPLDPRCNSVDLATLLNGLNASTVVFPPNIKGYEWVMESLMETHKSHVLQLQPYEPISINLSVKNVKGWISEKLQTHLSTIPATIYSIPVNSSSIPESTTYSISPIHALLQTRNNSHVLQPDLNYEVYQRRAKELQAAKDEYRDLYGEDESLSPVKSAPVQNTKMEDNLEEGELEEGELIESSDNEDAENSMEDGSNSDSTAGELKKEKEDVVYEDMKPIVMGRLDLSRIIAMIKTVFHPDIQIMTSSSPSNPITDIKPADDSLAKIFDDDFNDKSVTKVIIPNLYTTITIDVVRNRIDTEVDMNESLELSSPQRRNEIEKNVRKLTVRLLNELGMVI
ncbi:beta-lactamase-like protein [Paraphysoderma sedebokerense]|nr:beta-lactamase-like protein [Paraphysoderma sedebokerense]